MEIINIILALATAALGALSFFAPRYVMGALNLKTDGSTMGVSEVRATLGGVYLFLGLGVILTPIPYLALGIAYCGAALGRLLSILCDEPPIQKSLGFLAFEVIFAATLVLGNI